MPYGATGPIKAVRESVKRTKISTDRGRWQLPRRDRKTYSHPGGVAQPVVGRQTARHEQALTRTSGRTEYTTYVSGIQMSTTYFSEREHGLRPRTAEAISQPVRRALLRHIQVGIGNGSYGWRFPEQCGDGRGPCGTDECAFWDTAAAEVPDLLLPDNAWSEHVPVVNCSYKRV